MKYGIRVETFQWAGICQHRVYDLGVKPDRVGELSEAVVNAQKKVNEMLWEEMPDGATGVGCYNRI